MVNDCFLGERNEEIEVFAQALYKKNAPFYRGRKQTVLIKFFNLITHYILTTTWIFNDHLNFYF